MDLLIIRRGIIKAKITRIETFVTKATVHMENEEETLQSVDEFTTRIETLETAYSDFCKIQEAMLVLVDPTNKEQTEDILDNAVDIEEKYVSIKALLKTCISSFDDHTSIDMNQSHMSNASHRSGMSTHAADSMITRLIEQQTMMLDQLSANRVQQTENQYSNIYLKPLKIPEFGGDYYSWKSFCDIFTNAVHENRRLSNVQKLHYLKESLTGEAAQLIKHITITDANYHTSSSLRKVISTSNEVIHSLKALGPDHETRDCWLIYIILEKLDIDTKKYWAEKVVSLDNPTFAEFIAVICNGFKIHYNLSFKNMRVTLLRFDCVGVRHRTQNGTWILA